ncbi:MAG: ADP-forming succinate--CoA ligase subunit beta [Candidatus Dormibacteria bacterium]
MKLLEYQAKEMLAGAGIPIPPGRLAHTPEEAAAAAREIGAVAVKAQVPVGGRGKAGGIKLADTPEAAAAAAGQILGMDIKGHTVPTVYCEGKLDVAQEVYLGITLDRDARGLVMILSASGGMDIEQVAAEAPEKLARLNPDPWKGVQDFELRGLVFAAGLGAHVAPIVKVARQLYLLAQATDATTLEINPLVITTDGLVVAGDAKLESDENAAYRHPELARFEEAGEGDQYERAAKERNLTYVSLSGDIGIIGNGAGLVMTTLDLVKRAGGDAANFCDIGGGAKAEVVRNALEVILMNPKVRGVLINVFGGITRCDEVARGLVEARDSLKMDLPLVVRMTGTREEEGRAILREHGIEPGSNGWEAASKIVELAKTGVAV